LNAHPAVAQSAVVGRSVGGDEEVIAFVQLVPDSQLTKIELADFAAEHLGKYKRPSQIIFVPSMPVTPTGKVVKGELLKMMADHLSTELAPATRA
jgi:acyl-coenzyme A synthetase/AMP-(fatty) acid ligase